MSRSDADYFEVWVDNRCALLLHADSLCAALLVALAEFPRRAIKVRHATKEALDAHVAIAD